MTGTLRPQVACFVADEAGGTMMVFALTLPVLMVAAAAAVDYSLAASTWSKMQAVADSAALASVRELQLARADSARITAVANNVVHSALQNATAAVKVDFQAMTVKVSSRSNTHQ
jgi:Flp pilus assembly protein TadG